MFPKISGNTDKQNQNQKELMIPLLIDYGPETISVITFGICPLITFFLRTLSSTK